MGRAALVLALGLGAAAGRAAAGEPSRFALEPSHAMSFGTRAGFRSSASSLAVGLPRGFRAAAEHSSYEAEGLPFTSVWRLSGSWEARNLWLFGGWLYLPRSEGDSQSRFEDAQASGTEWGAGVRTDSERYWTALIGSVALIHHSQFSETSDGVSLRRDIGQRVATARLVQRARLTEASLEASNYTYQFDLIPAVVAGLRRREVFAAGELRGLARGFPQHSLKLRLSQGLGFVPVKVWGSYQRMQFDPSGVLNGGTADSYRAGAELKAAGRVTAGADWQYFRQEHRGKMNLYGFSLSARIGG